MIRWRHCERCPHGHDLEYVGNSHMESWTCSGGSRCRHSSFEMALIDRRFGRFRCTSGCDFSLCESCFAGDKKVARTWAKITKRLLPKEWVPIILKTELLAIEIRMQLAMCYVYIAMPFRDSREGARCAALTYLACVAAAGVLIALQYHLRGRPLEVLWACATTLFWLVVGATPFVLWLPRAQQLRTALRAHASARKYRKRRAKGGCRTLWPFFTPDAECRQPPPEESCST